MTSSSGISYRKFEQEPQSLWDLWCWEKAVYLCLGFAVSSDGPDPFRGCQIKTVWGLTLVESVLNSGERSMSVMSSLEGFLGLKGATTEVKGR